MSLSKCQIKCTALIFLVLCLVSCGGISTVNETEYAELKNIVSSSQFEVEHDWAIPLGGGNINLIGNPNFIRFEKDSVEVYLPYFGVRQSGGNYGSSEGGIIYSGALNDFQIAENEDKGNIEISFKAKENSENFEFRLILYPNKKVRTQVISSQRTSISYEGEIVDNTKD